MSVPEPWPDLHDAELMGLRVGWERGDVVLDLRRQASLLRIRASGLRRLEAPRVRPWGPSLAIGQVVGPREHRGHVELVLELKSGDRVRIHAEAFELELP
ncbi:MAG: hypothetical protein AAGH15_20625 [Myxococcota bacterium]